MTARSAADFRRRLAEVESYLKRLDEISAEEDRERAADAVRAVLQLHGEVLGRLLCLVADQKEQGASLVSQICQDEAIAGLLILHGVHPLSLVDRLETALDSVRPYLRSHGGDAELVSVEQGVVRLRLRGSCSSCPSSAVTLQYAVEDALRKSAPDLVSIEVEEGADQASRAPAFIPLEQVRPLPGHPSPATDWTTVARVDQVASGEPQAWEVAGTRVLVVRLDQSCWVYALYCPECARSLEGAHLEGEALVCPGCGGRYGLRTAGRSLAGDPRQLRPIPMLVDGGLLQIATAALVA